jgi:prevent-host-death family protein
MKSITIRELHEKTGEYIRKAAETGEIYVTDRGRTIAKIVPEHAPAETPYFARRKFTPAFRRLMKAGRLRSGADSTSAISEDRERPIR